ncbi:SAM-dependent methyltransferase [Colwellia sp. KU-HH00111]|uniref:hypothetical protein n=1 Tax=Colwellia sp. KU-HH00111 TaxID=3127652 RepID=UPI00310B60D1
MQLAKHIAQGNLLYLSQSNQRLSVSENAYYRWLAFASPEGEQVIQSVMLKRKPWRLTLPHQTALMLPLLFFKPNRIVELGLGGGNIQRFISHLSSAITIDSVEHYSEVIDCFNQFFNPQSNPVHLIYSDSTQWLLQNTLIYDWFICDIYQQDIQSYNSAVNQLTHLTRHITPSTCLSINLPDATDQEVNLLLTILQQVSRDHNITYFHVPNYLNIVIHLLPKQWQIYKRSKRNSYSYLPKSIFSKWQNFWQHGKNI